MDKRLESNLQKALYAESAAVIGASADLSKLGGRALHYLRRHGFQGEIYPINPRGGEIDGLRVYPSLTEVGKPVDVALVVIPGAFVTDAIKDCAAAGVAGAVVLSGGFAESGEEGRQREDEIAAIAHEAGLALIGPNCLGIINVHHRLALSSAVSLEADLLPSDIALVTQSGVLLGTLLGRARDRGIGFSHLISCGNQTILEASDFIQVLAGDPNVAVVASYIEGFKKPRSLLDAASRMESAGKPFVVLKAGLSDAGARAAASHTGALVGSRLAFDGVCRSKRIVTVDTPDELIETAAMFSRTPRMAAGGVAVMASSGGLCSLLADKFSEIGIELAAFSSRTEEKLRALIGSWHAANPFDFGSADRFDIDGILGCFDAICEDPGVGLVYIAVSDLPGVGPYIDGLVRRWRGGMTKPLCLYWFAGSVADDAYENAKEAGLPLFTGFVESLRAISSMAQRSQMMLQDDQGAAPGPSRTTNQAVPDDLIRDVAHEVNGMRILESFGLPVADYAFARSAEEAAAAANRIGYPVAVKVVSPDIAHKAGAGGVRLGVPDEQTLIATVEDVCSAAAAACAGAAIQGVVVQEMIPAGIELIAGVKIDDDFGPLLVTGLGGIYSEALDDIAVRLCPVTVDDAAAMLSEIRAAGFLAAHLARYPDQRKDLLALLVRLSEAAVQLEELISEIDINPIILPSDGRAVRAVDALVVPSQGEGVR